MRKRNRNEPLPEQLFAPREIESALNTAVLFTRHPESRNFKRSSERLHEYARAITDPLIAMVETQLLTPEELVFVLTGAAMYVHKTCVDEGKKGPQMPAGPLAMKLMETTE